MDISRISIILPAKDEAEGLQKLLPALCAQYAGAEIIVVDDCSEDDTAGVCRGYPVRLIRHPYAMGNGAAVKTGARHARGDVLVFMDADGQHDPQDVGRLLVELDRGFNMVVGERRYGSPTSWARRLGNALYNWLASYVSGQRIGDLTSGLRAVDAHKFREFLHILPNGFSYPASITMAFLRAGYPVTYVPIQARSRIGRSHIRLLRDGLRFLLIIFRVGTLYSPLKIYVPASLLFFVTGLGYYLFTYVTQHRFTNMSALLLITAVVVFLIGLISEQITMLLYAQGRKR
jgi:glycosyltransferase involved in cell wall biosynthesis